MDERANLLIIGSNLHQADGLPRRLEEAGYRAALAGDSEQGLALLHASTADLVLVDLRNPDTDAVRLLARMKADDGLRDIPVILLASPHDLEGVDQALAGGAEDYLLAPFSPTLLKAQVRDYLEIGRRRIEQRDRARREESLKIERDVHIARQIQASFLPSELPQPTGWQFAARFHPAREVAGDFYDAFLMIQGRRVGFVIADVVDKGVGAALFMALVRSLTRAFAQQNYGLGLMDTLADESRARRGVGRKRGAPSMGTTSLRNAVALTNNYITTNHLELNMFATLFFGMLDPVSGEVAYINGGHNPPFIIGPDGVMKAKLKGTGPAVGMLPDADFQIEEAQLDPGDILYLYTDGVPEARNEGGEFFGEQRLLSLLAQPAGSALALLDRIDDQLVRFVGRGLPFDDVTMMAVRRRETGDADQDPAGGRQNAGGEL